MNDHTRLSLALRKARQANTYLQSASTKDEKGAFDARGKLAHAITAIEFLLWLEEDDG